MVLLDVNILVYAYREDSPRHGDVRPWLDEVINGNAAFGVSELVLSGFLRIVTHPRVFDPPTPIAQAIEFVRALREQPHCLIVKPGDRHWDIFLGLCLDVHAKGNVVPDAYLAALAIESGSEWVTTDRDFARFAGLTWRYPVAPAPV